MREKWTDVWWEAFLKERFWESEQLPLVLFYSFCALSELSHDVSWYFLYCELITGHKNVGVISSRADQKFRVAFMCAHWKCAAV